MKDIVISVGFREGKQKVSILITQKEFDDAASEELGAMLCTSVAKLKDLEPEPEKENE